MVLQFISAATMSQRKSVALVVETATHYGRQVLAGILRYKIEKANWRVFVEQQDLNAPPPVWVKDWPGDGVICRLTTPEVTQFALERGLPLVELNDRKHQPMDLVTFRSDDEMIGTMAAEHLIERSFTQFAFLGSENESWSERRERGFKERVIADHHCFQCLRVSSAFATYLIHSEEVANWLHALPKPVGIMACNDIHAKLIIDICQAESLAVPEQVAVIGVDNDELICKFCEPMLSSITPSAKELGYRAAESLDRLMQNQDVTPMSQVVEPIGVCVRASSDTFAIKDEQFAKALYYIRQNACNGISVEDVLDNTELSRSSLERRTRKLLNRSPQQFIRQVQLERVKTLLADTDLQIETIANMCGFGHPEYLHVMFKREFNQTPGEYRRSAQH